MDTIVKNISLINPGLEFIPRETLFFFDELQDCANCATSLKAFYLDGRYDVICSGSLIEKSQYSDIHYGIKLGYKNIGFNGKFYTFPYFLTFLLKRFLREKRF